MDIYIVYMFETVSYFLTYLYTVVFVEGWRWGGLDRFAMADLHVYM